MRNIHPDSVTPPAMADVRLPHLSTKRNAGTDTTSISTAETPDARKEAVFDETPACEKRIGAYCYNSGLAQQSMIYPCARSVCTVSYSRRSLHLYPIAEPFRV